MKGNPFSRRSFLRAAAVAPAAAILPSQVALGAAANTTLGTTSAIPVIRMAFNRFSVTGALETLTGILLSTTKTTDKATAYLESTLGQEARQVRQMSDLMRHIHDLREKGIEFSDFSRESLTAWQGAMSPGMESASTNIHEALKALESLRASGCENWQDVTRQMMKKALPLIRGLEDGDFISKANGCGNDGGVLGAINHLSKEFEDVLGVDYQPYKISLNQTLQSLDNRWKGACTEIIESERQKFALNALNTGEDTLKAKPERLSTPEKFRHSVDVEPLFPPMKSSVFFFRIIPKKGMDVNFVDLCRISRKLTSGGALPVSRPRMGGKQGFVISTGEQKLVDFLFGCRSASAKNHKPKVKPLTAG